MQVSVQVWRRVVRNCNITNIYCTVSYVYTEYVVRCSIKSIKVLQDL